VFISTSDPVASGLVASLARPGGNVTGFSNIYSELSGKGLELVKELLPKISVRLLYGTQLIRLRYSLLRKRSVRREHYVYSFNP